MKIAHYYYNEYGRKFCDYLPDSFEMLDNKCDGSVDVIYCGTTSLLKDALIAKYKYNKPLICWVWDIPAEIGRNVDYVIAGLKECDYVVSASKFTKDVLSFQYGIMSEQMYFYVDMPVSAFDDDKIYYSPFVLQVSRFVPHKRFEVAIKAANRGIPIQCIGNSVDHNYFKTLPHNVGVNFKFNLSKESLISHLRAAHILVSPSIFEGWGLSPIEAIACGTPIILNDLPVFREVWGDVAIYHKQDDAEDLHNKISGLIYDTDRQKDMVLQGQEIIKDFTPKKFAERWIDLF